MSVNCHPQLMQLEFSLNQYFRYFNCNDMRFINFKTQTQIRKNRLFKDHKLVLNSMSNFKRLQIQIAKMYLILKKSAGVKSWQDYLQDLELVNQILDQVAKLSKQKPQKTV